jgi:hypothetical protein
MLKKLAHKTLDLMVAHPKLTMVAMAIGMSLMTTLLMPQQQVEAKISSVDIGP